MSTDLKDPTPRTDRARSLYAGYKGNSPVGEIVRGMIRKGRSVVQQETPRWQENRAFYDGAQWVRPAIGAQHLNQINSSAAAGANKPGYNAHNHLRKNIKARTALLTKEFPTFDVLAEDNDQDSLEAARFAEKFCMSRLGQEAWDVKGALLRLAKYGDIDGHSWLCVEWDPDKSESLDQPLAVRLDGTPITDRSEYEALKAQDPEAQVLWRMIRSNRPLGDVTWRVVLPAALSVDPFAHNSFEDARWISESRIRPRGEVERRMGKSYKQAVEESNERLAESAGNAQYQDIAVGDGSGKSLINESDGVLVHYFYAKPSPDFPKGARIELLDRAPANPLRAEPWEDDLPYFCYLTDEDPGHFLRAKGCADDLKPLQRRYNSTNRWLDMWLFKVAYAPLGVPVGSMRGQEFYNEEMVYEYHPSMGQPIQTQVPAEPTAVFTNHLMALKQEMEDLSGVSAAARGFTVPNAPESSAGINQQIQQVEHNLSEAEAQLKRAIEWGFSRSLKLVERHYTRPRTVTAVGVDDPSELRSFTGQMIRGAHRFRVTSSLMPKSKAAVMASIKELAPLMPPDTLQAYLPRLIEGDPSDLQRDVDESRKHQQEEINDMLSLVTNPMARQVWENTKEDIAAFAQAMNQANAAAAGAPPNPITGMPMTGMDILGSQGITPIYLTDMLNAAGVEVPMVEPVHDVHPVELKACNSFRLKSAYKKTDPMFKQLLREHMQRHEDGQRAQLQAMAQQSPLGQQSGSQPNPKGTPSPPKNTPTGSKP